jgi:hypothetical protein
MSTTQVSDAMRVTTSLDATKLTGNLPAISGASLTGVVGKIVQVVNFQTGVFATGTATIPLDNTIPQITEGTEYNHGDSSMTYIGEVIGWKFNHQAGMSTKAGKITAFPGGIPSQVDQSAWTARIRSSRSSQCLQR